MKILIFIEHKVVIRNFIDSKAFSLLEKKHELVYVLPFGHKRLGNLKKEDFKIGSSKIINLPVNKKRAYIWRVRFIVELLRGQKGWNKDQIKSKRRIFKNINPLKVYLVYRFLGLPIIFNLFTFFATKKLNQNPNIHLENLIKTEKPNIMMHPSVLEGVYINDLVSVGNRFNIPVLVIMNSWDNPSSKRSVVSNNYWLLVWGPQTKQHARKLMNMSEEKVIEFGSAQFDIYSQNPNKNKKDILSFHEVKDTTIPTILYAGSSKSTNEFNHLKIIDEAINTRKLPRINIIYRPHPWGKGGKDSFRFKSYNFDNIVIDKNMKNYLLKNSNVAYYSAKYSDTRDLLYAVDAVISPLSTILIEGMIMGKAPLCFMPIEEKGAKHFQLAKHNTHFKELLSTKEILVVWGGENLLEGIFNLIKKFENKNLSEDLKKASKFFVKDFDRKFQERIVDFIDNFTHLY